MDTFVSVCAGLALIAVTVAAVYLVFTLVQFKKTARSVELLVDNLNEETAKFQKITAGLSQAAGFASDFLGKGSASAVGLAGAFLRGFFSRMRRNSDGDAEEKEASEKEASNQ